MNRYFKETRSNLSGALTFKNSQSASSISEYKGDHKKPKSQIIPRSHH